MKHQEIVGIHVEAFSFLLTTFQLHSERLKQIKGAAFENSGLSFAWFI